MVPDYLYIKEKKAMNKNKEMGYGEFMAGLMAGLKGMMGKEYSFFMDDIPVINGNVKHSLTIRKGNNAAAPCICMDRFYHDYVNGYMKMEDIAEMAAGIYRKEMEHGDLDTEFIKDWESARKKIRFRLVNTERNAGMLSGMPYREFLDLSVIYYVQVSMPGKINGMAHIHDRFLSFWDVDEEDLYCAAVENMPDTELRSIVEVIGAFGTSEDVKKTNNMDGLLCGMYVLTNRNGLYGAACMLNMEMMRKAADSLGSDLWILPSSIHELILIPKQEFYNVQDIAKMVKDVNDTELRPDELLSYHVYEYNRETEKVSIAA